MTIYAMEGSLKEVLSPSMHTGCHFEQREKSFIFFRVILRRDRRIQDFPRRLPSPIEKPPLPLTE
jgi:hypothetical protein